MLDVARRQYSAVTFDHADDAEAFPYHEGEFDAAFPIAEFIMYRSISMVLIAAAA
jgi:hypothetical protein